MLGFVPQPNLQRILHLIIKLTLKQQIAFNYQTHVKATNLKAT